MVRKLYFVGTTYTLFKFKKNVLYFILIVVCVFLSLSFFYIHMLYIFFIEVLIYIIKIIIFFPVNTTLVFKCTF